MFPRTSGGSAASMSSIPSLNDLYVVVKVKKKIKIYIKIQRNTLRKIREPWALCKRLSHTKENHLHRSVILISRCPIACSISFTGFREHGKPKKKKKKNMYMKSNNRRNQLFQLLGLLVLVRNYMMLRLNRENKL